MRILVIEDEPDLLRTLSQALREAGYAVDIAADGLDGLFKALAGEYDIILLDLMLPKLDGYAVLRDLRRSKTTPVLILTARDAMPDRIKGFDVGADDYMTKPFELVELLARVHAMIRRNAGGAVSVDGVGEMTRQTLAHTASRFDLARQIQMRLTASQLPQLPSIDVAVHYEPAQWVSGDYCDLWDMKDGRLALVVADVSGKGLPAAMVMASLHASLHAGIAFCPGPAQAVDYVNHHLSQHLPSGLFVTLFFGLLDVATGRLEYVNAGHVPPWLVSHDGRVQALAAPVNTVLGIGAGRFEARTQHLQPGDCLLAVTDGITESSSPEGVLFGAARLTAVLEGQRDATAQQRVSRVAGAAAEFRNAAARQDDETTLAVRWLGPLAPEPDAGRDWVETSAGRGMTKASR